MDLITSVRNSIDACTAWIRSVQNNDGGLPSDKEGSYSCTWTTSGLLWSTWNAGTTFHEFYMRKALGWVLDNRNPDQGIPIVVKGDHSITDATAQTVIACSLALGDVDDDLFRNGLKSSVEWLLYHRLGNEGWNWRSSNEPSWTASTVFAVLALHYSSRILPEIAEDASRCALEATQWLRQTKNVDGGWGAYKGDQSRPALTGLVCSVLSELDVNFDNAPAINFILREQHADGSWSDTIDRPTGHTVNRLGTPHCLRALADCGHRIDSKEFQDGMTAFMRAFDHGRFRYRDTDMLSWPTRDHLLALTSIGRRLGLPNCRTLSTFPEKKIISKTPRPIRQWGSTASGTKSRLPTFRLELHQESDDSVTASCFDTSFGEATENIRLPFSYDQLTTILKALDARTFNSDMFTPDQSKLLADLEILDIANQQFSPNILRIVGRFLYQSIFKGDVGDAFKLAFSQSRRSRKSLNLQFRLAENAASLARYPWELLNDGRRHLVAGGAVQLIRYVSYPESQTSLSLARPLQILVATSRPKDLGYLGFGDEWSGIRNALQQHVEAGNVVVDHLNNATYDSLREKLEKTEYQVLHLDGHGMLARLCPVCKEMHYPHHRKCTRCGASMEMVPSVGFFAFEDSEGDVDFVDSVALQNLLIVSDVRLAVVTGCHSSSVREGSIFGGLGPIRFS